MNRIQKLPGKKIRAEANNFLFTFYKNGKLVGKKPAEAYFVTIGLQSMTAQDIALKKKVLLAGFAEFKPAEFTIIKVETPAGI